jgi:hypothetical protein
VPSSTAIQLHKWEKSQPTLRQVLLWKQLKSCSGFIRQRTDLAVDLMPSDRYCECFAAGIYCVSSCACQECFNKPEFEETVLNTRQQIESRNPLAFAPKIVQAAKASPRTGVGCFVMSLHILKP